MTDPNLVPISTLAVEFGISVQEIRQAARRLGLALFVQYSTAATYVNRAGAAHLRAVWKDENRD